MAVGLDGNHWEQTSSRVKGAHDIICVGINKFMRVLFWVTCSWLRYALCPQGKADGHNFGGNRSLAVLTESR